MPSLGLRSDGVVCMHVRSFSLTMRMRQTNSVSLLYLSSWVTSRDGEEIRFWLCSPEPTTKRRGDVMGSNDEPGFSWSWSHDDGYHISKKRGPTLYILCASVPFRALSNIAWLLKRPVARLIDFGMGVLHARSGSEAWHQTSGILGATESTFLGRETETEMIYVYIWPTRSPHLSVRKIYRQAVLPRPYDI